MSNAESCSTATLRRWTGRTEFSLIDGHGQHRGAISVAIGPEALTLRYENRLLAIMDRDTFRAWLTEMRSPLRIHDVLWFTRTGLTCISIEQVGAFVVPGNCIDQLASVV